MLLKETTIAFQILSPMEHLPIILLVMLVMVVICAVRGVWPLTPQGTFTLQTMTRNT